jgi:hypothetical protein
MTYQYFNVGPNMNVYDITVNSDIEDIIYPSTKVHEWVVSRYEHFADIHAIPEMINEFGQIGGFEIILQVLDDIAQGTFQPSVKYL